MKFQETPLTSGLSSFRTELGDVNLSSSLEQRYQYYKQLLGNQPSEDADEKDSAGSK
jgi:hypothetical protein